ncbi:MAG TPA: protein TolA [Pseudolabrys sp.]|nr:protein TolA [Pseudolabrys sp.]
MQIRTASVISAALHVAVLGWATLSFSSKAFEVTPPESLPVDIISDKDFSEITKGVKDAKKVEEAPKPVVEKIAEPPPKPVEELKPTINEKREVADNKEAPPPPKPEPKPVEKKPEAKPEPPKPDAIAEKLKDEKPKQEAKADPQPLPPKKPPPPKPQAEPKFDANKIAALLDKRDPTRSAATGSEINRNASLGAANANAARLTQSEIDAFRRRVASCWTIPVGAEGADNLKVVFRVQFRRDGTVERGPDPVEGSASPYGPAFADSGRRAILQCQPYTMLRQEHYDSWKDIEIGFTPRDMFQ